MHQLFENRSEAGRLLAERLTAFEGQAGAIVLGLPRGGLPVACEVAEALGLPLDVFTARKVGVPSHEELAMGAVASGGVRVRNEQIIEAFEVAEAEVARRFELVAADVQRHELRYRGNRPPVDVHGSVVILVDDGIATGATVRAAILALRALGVRRIVVAAPVAAADSVIALQHKADEVIALRTPARFLGVGAWYREFPEIEEDEVRTMLERAAERLPEEARHAAHRHAHTR